MLSNTGMFCVLIDVDVNMPEDFDISERGVRIMQWTGFSSEHVFLAGIFPVLPFRPTEVSCIPRRR